MCGEALCVLWRSHGGELAVVQAHSEVTVSHTHRLAL